MFDMSAAFNMIDKDILIKKLSIYGVGKRSRDWVDSYLTDRLQYVHIKDSSSKMVKVPTGSPQGSCLSPLLFLIMIADIDHAFSGESPILFADDANAVVTGASWEDVLEAMEIKCQEMAAYARNNKLALNPTKTEFITFQKKACQDIGFEGAKIQESKHVKLLGVVINKSQTWKDHLDALKPELSRRIGGLRRLAHHLPKRIVTQLVQPFYTAKAVYGLEIVADPTMPQDPVIERLQKGQNEALRAALRTTRVQRPRITDMHEQAGCPLIKQIAIRSVGNAAFEMFHPEGEWKDLAGQIGVQSYARNSRAKSKGILPVDNHSRDLKSKAARLWNVLPERVQTSTRKSFRSEMKIKMSEIESRL